MRNTLSLHQTLKVFSFLSTPCFFIIFFAIIGGCNHDTSAKKKDIHKVGFVKAQPVSVSFSRTFVARLHATDHVTLYPRVSGHLIKRHFQEGSAVHKGQTLFTIDPIACQIAVEEAQAKLSGAQAKLVETQKNLERGKKLLSNNTISQEQYDQFDSQAKQSNAAVATAKAELKKTQLELSYTKIHAPFDGVMGKSHYSIGSLLNASDHTPLAEIINTDPIYAQFQINENDFLQHFRTNDTQQLAQQFRIELILSNETHYPHLGQLNYIDPVISQETDTILLRASFENASGLLRPGMYGTVKMVKKQSEQLAAVPKYAIQQGKQGTFLYILNDNSKLQRKNVILGPQIDNLQSIRSGIHIQDKVIVAGFMNARRGQKVNASEVESHNGIPSFPSDIHHK